MMKLRALVAGIGSFLLAGSIHAAPIYYIYDLGALVGHLLC
jgi:hypothetical protein